MIPSNTNLSPAFLSGRRPRRGALVAAGVWLGMAALLLGLALPADAKDRGGSAENTRMEMSDFKTRGMDDDGKQQWDLLGANAVLEGALATLKTVTVTFHTDSGEPVVITSPNCVFNKVTKIGSSDAPIHIQHPQGVIDGQGYDIMASQKRVHIRSNVRMTIKSGASPLALGKVLSPATAGQEDGKEGTAATSAPSAAAATTPITESTP